MGSLELFARIRAAMERGADRRQVLRGAGLAPVAWIHLAAPGRVILRATEVDTAADVVRTTADAAVTTVGRLEVEASRVVEHAGDAYRHVEGLAELQAGRARTLVEGSYQVVAERATIQSDEDTTIDGKRVLLG